MQEKKKMDKVYMMRWCREHSYNPLCLEIMAETKCDPNALTDEQIVSLSKLKNIIDKWNDDK